MDKNSLTRLLARIVVIGDCEVFTGSLNRDGYGQFWIDGKNWRAHRARWFLEGKDLGNPETHLKLDHACNNRACVRLDHLQLISQRENVLRSATNPIAINARKTHCINGHLYTEASTGRDNAGYRYCRECYP
jgi:hypothetical protein